MTRILNHFNILNHWSISSTFNTSISLYRYWDKGLLQIIGPFGINKVLHLLSFKLELLSTSYIIHYFLYLELSLKHPYLL